MARLRDRAMPRRDVLLLPVLLASSAALDACGRAVASPSAEGSAGEEAPIELHVSCAASLDAPLAEVVAAFQESHPGADVQVNADSSGTLAAQIEEGFSCDVFLSAAERQMDQLERDGFVVAGTRRDILANRLVVVARADSATHVTGIESLGAAASLALAAPLVPAGAYTREALVRAGILPAGRDVASYTSAEVSAALGGVEVSEQSNVTKVLATVAEGSCEVGTVYASDLVGHEGEFVAVAKVPSELTGPITYPACLIQDDEADGRTREAAQEFLDFVCSDEAQALFERHGLTSAVTG